MKGRTKGKTALPALSLSGGEGTPSTSRRPLSRPDAHELQVDDPAVQLANAALAVLAGGEQEHRRGRYQSRPISQAKDGLTVVVPIFNEEGALEQTIAAIDEILETVPLESEILAVNDGSSDRTGALLESLSRRCRRLYVLHNSKNLGYGASLKRAIRNASYNRILITDADGTYPHSRIPHMVARLDNADMVVGARTTKNAQIPWSRRPAKWLMLRYARWVSHADIKDVNSGMRVFWKEHAERYWGMFPNGFSFTTTITLAMHSDSMTVEYLPIDYAKRVGKSSIQPIQDTIRFFALIFRTGMYFRPLQVFGTGASVMMLSAGVFAAFTKWTTGVVPDVTTVSLFTTGLVLLGLGLIGDLVNARLRK